MSHAHGPDYTLGSATFVRDESMKRQLASLCCVLTAAVFALPGCAADEAPPTSPAEVSTDWNQDMSEEELREIAEALGVALVEDGTSSKVTKDDIVDALEDATGCGCFGAVCGVGDCGHECGACADGESCFSGTCETEDSCPTATVTATSEEAVLFNDTESLKFRYDATLPEGSAFDRIRVAYNASVDEELPPGTYNLRHRGLNDCKPCVVAYKDCLPDGPCATSFVAQAGTIQIDEITPDGRFRGSLTDIKFETAYEDPKSGLYTILSQFGSNCVPTFSFDAKLESIIQEPQDCDPEGNGNTIGNKLADFTLVNCNGEDVNLHSACGKKALWLIAAAGW